MTGPKIIPVGDRDGPKRSTKNTKPLTFQGSEVETQRLRITTERLSEFTSDFVHVFHSWGDDSVTDMLFTNAEARYLSAVLREILHAWESGDGRPVDGHGPQPAISGLWNQGKDRGDVKRAATKATKTRAAAVKKAGPSPK